MIPMLQFLSEAAGGNTLAADTTTLIDTLKAVAGIFSIFPVNLFLAAGIGLLAFKLFKQGKNAAK